MTPESDFIITFHVAFLRIQKTAAVDFRDHIYLHGDDLEHSDTCTI